MADIKVKCVSCGSTEVIKFGKQSGHQRYYCKHCKKAFQLDYTYKACEPGVIHKTYQRVYNIYKT